MNFIKTLDQVKKERIKKTCREVYWWETVLRARGNLHLAGEATGLTRGTSASRTIKGAQSSEQRQNNMEAGKSGWGKHPWHAPILAKQHIAFILHSQGEKKHMDTTFQGTLLLDWPFANQKAGEGQLSCRRMRKNWTRDIQVNNNCLGATWSSWSRAG